MSCPAGFRALSKQVIYLCHDKLVLRLTCCQLPVELFWYHVNTLVCRVLSISQQSAVSPEVLVNILLKLGWLLSPCLDGFLFHMWLQNIGSLMDQELKHCGDFKSASVPRLTCLRSILLHAYGSLRVLFVLRLLFELFTTQKLGTSQSGVMGMQCPHM